MSRYSFSKDRVPTSKTAEKTRLETFHAGDGWPHDNSHSASPKKMAQAGFVYTPADVGDDQAMCLFCSVSLSGWADGDDPLYVPRSRNRSIYSIDSTLGRNTSYGLRPRTSNAPSFLQQPTSSSLSSHMTAMLKNLVIQLRLRRRDGRPAKHLEQRHLQHEVGKSLKMTMKRKRRKRNLHRGRKEHSL